MQQGLNRELITREDRENYVKGLAEIKFSKNSGEKFLNRFLCALLKNQKDNSCLFL
jgi:hypothetical protein